MVYRNGLHGGVAGDCIRGARACPDGTALDVHRVLVWEGEYLEGKGAGRVDFDLSKADGPGAAVPEVIVQQMDQAEVSTTLNQRSIQDLPNITRNATSFVLLSPGTTQSTFNNSISENAQLSTPVSANGQSPFSAGFLLDGADNKDSFLGVVIVNPPLDSTGFVAAGTALGAPPAGTAPGGLGLATVLFGNVNKFQRFISSATDASERQKRTFSGRVSF